MSDDVAVLWLDPGEAREESVGPRASAVDARRALTEWARARGVRLVSLEDSPSPPLLDPSVAERIETEIARAREAIGAIDPDPAERALARAETLLRAHPELPQAAWLRAEVERTWSARWLRVEPKDEVRARVASETAHALDGGRVSGIGEAAFPPRPRVKASFVLSGTRAPGIALLLDGVPLTPAGDAPGGIYRAEVEPAEHHLVATADGRVLFASWVSLAGSEPAPVRVPLAEGHACASEQLAKVTREDGLVRAPGVLCPRWVAAAKGTRPGSVFVARCERDDCGPLLEWRVERYEASGPPQPVTSTGGWPAWATWTLVGIGVATATSMTLVATGALERRASEARFVVGGARQE